MLLNCGVGEDSWEPLGLQGDPTSPSWGRSVLGVHWKDWCWSWNSSTLATWCEELTHWKRPWCWEGLGAGGEEVDRGWDGWMGSSIPWTWVWVNSGSWRWTGMPDVLRFTRSQRVGHDWATELNGTESRRDFWKSSCLGQVSQKQSLRWQCCPANSLEGLCRRTAWGRRGEGRGRWARLWLSTGPLAVPSSGSGGRASELLRLQLGARLCAHWLSAVSLSANTSLGWECEHAKFLSRVQLCATLWTVAPQAPPSMGFSRQESWRGWPCPPGDLPHLEINAQSLTPPALVVGSSPEPWDGSTAAEEEGPKPCSHYAPESCVCARWLGEVDCRMWWFYSNSKYLSMDCQMYKRFRFCL